MYGLETIKLKKILFIHIPKTAGTTIHRSILGRPPVVESCHWTYMDYKEKFGKELLDSYWIFSFVRNPIDRFLSRIRYLKNNYSAGQPQHVDERNFVIKLSDPQKIADCLVENLDHWFLKKDHGISQYNYICNLDGEIAVDFVGVNEFFSKDIQEVMDYIGLGKFNPKVCQNFLITDKKHSELLENQEFIEKIQKIYPKDLDLYNKILKIRGHV